MICDECETVAHCMKNGCVPKTTKKDEALRLALEALTHGCPPDCKDGMTDSGGIHPWGEAALVPCPNCEAITALREALALDCSNHKPAPVAKPLFKPLIDLHPGLAEELKAMDTAQQEPVPCCGKYETCTQACTPRGRFLGKREALNASLAEQPTQQEPYCYTYTEKGEEYFAPPTAYVPDNATPLYTSPPAQRTWVGLTEPEVNDCYESIMFDQNIEPSRMGAYLEIEAKLKEKNSD